MSDLISRQDAINALDGEFTVTGKDNAVVVTNYLNTVRKHLENLPSAQPDMSEYSDKLWKSAYERGKADAQPKRGKWERVYPSRKKSYLRFCSVCREQCWYCGTGDYRYCPNCGAEMKGEQDEACSV